MALVSRVFDWDPVQVHTDVYSQFYQYQPPDTMQTAGIHPLKLAEETQFVVHNFGTNTGGWWCVFTYANMLVIN